MVYYFTPYNSNKLLGKAYNDVCKIVPNNNDWICLMDADTMFLSNNYGKQIEEVTKKHSQYDIFTCYATRIGGLDQRWKGKICNSENLTELKKEVLKAEKKYWGEVTELRRSISGHFLLFKKCLWDEIPFPHKSSQGSILGIDNVWSNRCLKKGKRIGRIDGLLVAHYYRLDSNMQDKSHLH